MNKTAWILLGLLLATNVAWLLRAGFLLDGDRHRPAGHAPGAVGGQRIAGLEEELAAARERIAGLETIPSRVPVPQAPAAEQAGATGAAKQRAEEERTARADRLARVQSLARDWVAAAMQTTDLGARVRALAEIRAALGSGDPASIEAALRSLARMRELEYDRAPFRDLVLPQLRSPDAGVRAASLYALWNTGPRPEDIEIVLPMAGDPIPEVRRQVARILQLFTKGQIEGRCAEAVVALLDDASAEVRRSTMGSLWGAKVDRQVEDRFLAMLERPETRHDAIYFGLSTFQEKSPQVVASLVDAMSTGDMQIAERARWGLGSGVPAASHATVAEAALRLLESRANPGVQRDCLKLLRQYGRAGQVSGLEVFAARPGLVAGTRKEIESVIAELRGR